MVKLQLLIHPFIITQKKQNPHNSMVYLYIIITQNIAPDDSSVVSVIVTILFHPHRTSGDLWFGLSLSGDNKYHHEDGTIINSGMFAYTFYNDPWASSEPSRGSTELCVRLRSEGSRVFRWADIGCSRSYPCLCQGVLSKLYNAIKSTTSLTVYHI